jgi:hypothetical protein
MKRGNRLGWGEYISPDQKALHPLPESACSAGESLVEMLVMAR